MFRVRDGDFTAFVYDSIAAGNYGTVIEFLRGKALTSPNSRAVQSVLGWCYVAQQNFVAAADCYERLTMIDPDNFTYWQSYAQCLSKAGFPGEALKIVNYVAEKGNPETIALLKASIRFQEGETRECKALLEKCAQTNPAIVRNQASVLFQQKEYTEAAAKFSQTAAMTGFDPGCVYGQAATAYEMKDFRQCAKYLNDIISRALSTHPQFSPPFDSGTENKQVFQNSPVLQQSYLIEAYNLKAAMEHHMGNGKSRMKQTKLRVHLFPSFFETSSSANAAQTSLNSIPPRNEEDIDMVTLHNKAILEAEGEPAESIAALTHIVSQPFYPKETLANLVTLYFREQQFDIAADFMAENTEVCFTQLPEDIYSLFEAVIIEQTAPEEAYVRFEELIVRYQEQLRKLSAQEKVRRREGSTDKLRAVESEYDHVLSRLQPAVMSQTVMYWDYKNYSQVEKQLKKAHEFLSDQQNWRINMGHTLFMLENYVEAAKFYEAVVKPQTTDMMKLSPVLLANLCVSYVMTSRNDEAEEILRRVEDAENYVVEAEGVQGSSTSSHLCVINLVIGTLYCSKGNFQFGLNRLLKSFEPSVSAKLNRTTWMYAKRMLLAALYALAHRDVMLATASLLDCIQFLRQCQDAGKSLLLSDFSNPSDTKSYVFAEASLLADLFCMVVYGQK
ncbi:hypothetical protein RvY_02779 [Ramazzottius varieornatus]|uniref:Tetratricopeptide repeat protein 30 n=1 Tax=Ramazzottius varieornatus TaxID=947166 RepID=A0A1D1URM0_RAMVA|nr:hypothetical protein RvY_02779 [Ramazzottius varieornatus]